MDEAFFRARHAADAANAARQPLADYLSWVRTFYEGKRFPPVTGWTKREVDILAALPAGDRDAARGDLAATGQLLAAEWSKDNAVRKVSTADLQAWGKRFGDASRELAALLTALREVRAEIERRVASA